MIAICSKRISPNLLILAGTLIFPASLIADHHKSELPDVIEVGQRPESITKGFDGDFFVTVMNGNEAGDGVIKRIHGSTVSVFARGFDEPKGICFAGGYLFATDVNKVRRIDSKGKVTILAGESDFPKAVSYLNDAAAAPDGKSIYITDMGANTGVRTGSSLHGRCSSTTCSPSSRCGRGSSSGRSRRSSSFPR